jgi:hypothetical protein
VIVGAGRVRAAALLTVYGMCFIALLAFLRIAQRRHPTGVAEIGMAERGEPARLSS